MLGATQLPAEGMLETTPHIFIKWQIMCLFMVPIVGIELTTYRLQGGCSTTELNRLGVRDRTRTCIVRICNPRPHHSGHTHIKFYYCELVHQMC